MKKTDILTGTEQLLEDLDKLFNSSKLSINDLHRLQESRSRLIKNTYNNGQGKGCFMFILTENGARISSKQDLIEFWADGDRYSEDYLAPKWLVRAFDRERCSRYQGVILDIDTLMEAVKDAIQRRFKSYRRLSKGCRAKCSS